MFAKVLIANRGEIAVRVARTAKRLGIRTVAIYSDADRDSLHVQVADEAWRIGPPPAQQSYLSIDAILAIAKRSGAEAIHPGYGFLAENPEFADQVTKAGLIFVGPPASAIRAMGHKDRARLLMEKAGVPVLPGYNGFSQSPDHLAREARRTGFPVLIKPVAGGGGKGMHRVDREEDFAEALAAACREAKSSFGDDRVLIEKFLATARHIEIQVFADAHGNTVHLFERDCSLQRRHQKVIEESPGPGMTGAMREKMGHAAVEAARAVGYVGAGTVEFIADVSDGLKPDRFYFMEMNTRLQVEHPVTEMVTGVDLVEWQFRVASGEPLPLKQEDLAISGHAVEARLYAEDPAQDFQPQAGRLTYLEFPDDVRVDTGVRQGDVVSTYYDPMLAKLIAHGPTRAAALNRLAQATAETRLGGCRTNLAFLNRLVRSPDFAADNIDTGFIARHISHLAKGGEPPPEAIAAALLHASGELSPPASSSPFDTLTNFRLWHGETRSFTFAIDGTNLDASLTVLGNRQFELLHNGRPARFTLVDHGAGALHLDFEGRIVPLTFFHHGDMLTVSLAGAIHEFASAGSAHGHGEDEEESGDVISPMPGSVGVIAVKPGTTIAKGETVAVIEAMKMEFALKAPRAGEVTAINVAPGDQVEEGQIIATIGGADD